MDVPRADAFESWTATAPPADVAERLESFEPAERGRPLRRLPLDRQAAVFRHLSCDAQREIVRGLDHGEVRAILEELDADDRVRFVEALPDGERQALLDLVGPEARRETLRALQYPPDSVGRLMSPNFAAVPARWRVREAIHHLRTRQLPPEKIATIYVTDEAGQLLDALALPRFVVADPESRVRDLMDGVYVSAHPEQDREQAVHAMQKHDLTALPVVDTHGTLVGVVSVDDVLEVAEEEATEDIQRQAGIEPLRAAYPDIAARSLFQKRLPWLAALIFVYLGASGVISAFEDALAAELVLASFIPLLMGSGGNVGAQSGTLIVRALAVGDPTGGRWRQALTKELWVGMVLGLALGVLAGIVGGMRGGWDVGLVVGASMFLIVVAANLTGTLLPVLLAKLGVDPAVAGSPVITSVTDLTSLVIYLGLASWMLAI